MTKKPPPGGPPGQQPPAGLIVVTVPGLIEAIGELVESIDDLRTAVEDQTAASERNTEAIVAAMNDLTEAVLVLAGPSPPVTQKKATSVSMSAVSETLGGDLMPPTDATTLPPIQCVPLQLYPDTQGFAITFTFNGSVDGEPTIICQGAFTQITQDPKVEQPSADTSDPESNIETLCTIHGKASQPADAPGNKIDFSVNFDVDDPSTPDTEKVVQVFEDAIEWIASSQPKATRVSLNAVVEPLT